MRVSERVFKACMASIPSLRVHIERYRDGTTKAIYFDTDDVEMGHTTLYLNDIKCYLTYGEWA